MDLRTSSCPLGRRFDSYGSLRAHVTPGHPSVRARHRGRLDRARRLRLQRRDLGGASASTNPSAGDGTQNAAFEKYRQCLKDNGVRSPTAASGPRQPRRLRPAAQGGGWARLRPGGQARRQDPEGHAGLCQAPAAGPVPRRLRLRPSARSRASRPSRPTSPASRTRTSTSRSPTASTALRHSQGRRPQGPGRLQGLPVQPAPAPERQRRGPAADDDVSRSST